MRRNLYPFAIIIVCLLVFSLSACNFDLNEIAGAIFTKHDFSEDGVQEIESAFSNLTANDFSGSVEWRAIIVKDSNETTMDVKIVAQKAADISKVATIVKKDDTTYRCLGAGSERYVINENTKKFYNSVGPEDISIFKPAEEIIKYGSLSLKDEEGNLLWDFVEKRDARIEDIKKDLVDSKEFEYCGTESKNDKLIVNFAVKVAVGSASGPAPLRIYYEINSEDSLSKVTIYFLQLPSSEIDLDALKIPTETLGYTDID